jgi:flagellar basal-body rod protein FlgG
MMRSLWTAASGMTAQQNNVDTIANNLANVNTTGYKTESAEFKSLLYQTLQTKTTTANGENKPVSAQVGLGTRNSSITSHYTQGSMLASDNTFAFAIEGDGFFAVLGDDGETYYTRNGNFFLSEMEAGSYLLCTSDGNAVLSSEGAPIIFNVEDANQITASADGEFLYPDEANNPQPLGISFGLFQFVNPSGLDKTSGGLLAQSEASGVPLNEADGTVRTPSTLKQGYLEGSNVNIATEMVNLITAQRAYELNSKAINASDEMLQQANQLYRS